MRSSGAGAFCFLIEVFRARPAAAIPTATPAAAAVATCWESWAAEDGDVGLALVGESRRFAPLPNGLALFALELVMGRSHGLLGLPAAAWWDCCAEPAPMANSGPRLVRLSGCAGAVAKNWVTGRRLNRGALAGVGGGAALSAKGPLIFSSS